MSGSKRRPAHALAIRAAAGRLQWGYTVAAEIDGLVVDRSADGAWTARGLLRDDDPFRLAQAPLMLVVPIRGGEAWSWPVVRSTRGAVPSRVWTATLGPRVEAAP